MSSTRTSSPYFSPNSIMAPSFCASSIGITRRFVGGIGEDFGIDDVLDAADFRVGHRLVVHEVEARLVRIDLRALLLHVVAEHFAQRLVHQVGGRVVAHGAGAGQHVDPGGDAVADGDACRS